MNTEVTLQDVVAELRLLRGAAAPKRQKPAPDMSSPVWSARHIAILLDCTVGNVENNVVSSPNFPGPRRAAIGTDGKRRMNRRWDRDKVMAWFESHPVEVRAVS